MKCVDLCIGKCPVCVARCDRKCPKYTLMTLNGLLFLGGAVLAVSGTYLQCFTGFLESDVITLLNYIKVNSVPLGTCFMLITYLLIGTGILTMIGGAAGFLGAKKKAKGCLVVYTGFLILLMVLEGAILGFWIHVRSKEGNWLEGHMQAKLKLYEGPERHDEVSSGWNKMFMKSRCCAVLTWADFVAQDTIWSNNKNAQEDVPATCCQGVEDDTISDHVLSTCSTVPQHYYTKGCYTVLVDTMSTHSLVSYITVGILFLLQVLAIVFVCVVKDSKRNLVAPVLTITKPGGRDLVGRPKFSRV